MFSHVSTQYICIHFCSLSIKNAFEVISEQLLMCVRWIWKELFKKEFIQDPPLKHYQLFKDKSLKNYFFKKFERWVLEQLIEEIC